MDAVASEAGITKPVLYQHFGSKRQLFLELLRDVGGRLSDMVGKAVAQAETPRAQVEKGFSAYFHFVGAHREEFALLFGEGVRLDAEFAREVAAVETSLAVFVANLIEIEELTDDDRLLLAYGILGLAESAGRHWAAAGGHGDVDALAARMASLAWLGLRGGQSAG